MTKSCCYQNGEHRIVIERSGQKIPKGFHVHHINGCPRDNRFVNLMIVSQSKHRLIHRNTKWVKICQVCGGIRNRRIGKYKFLNIPETLHTRLKELAARNRMYLEEFVTDKLWKIAKER